LGELQKFLAEELSDVEGGARLNRSFQPLTDGLGLESPNRAPAAVPPPIPVVKKAAPEKAKQKAQPPPEPKPMKPDTISKSDWSLGNALAGTKPIFPTAPKGPKRHREEVSLNRNDPRESTNEAAQVFGDTGTDFEMAAPPPMPAPSLLRRALAGFLDELFVLGLWVGSLLITSSFLSGYSGGSLNAVLSNFSHPLFLRFAALEFATVWLCYFAVGIGLLDMTFGMWVWGMRIAYPEVSEEAQVIKKVVRIVLSFFFFAPVVPALVLAVRIHGRNLLDWLSSSKVYHSPA
jgi:hypothetical protein